MATMGSTPSSKRRSQRQPSFFLAFLGGFVLNSPGVWRVSEGCSCGPPFYSRIQNYRRLAELVKAGTVFDPDNHIDSMRVNFAEELASPAKDLEHGLWKLVWTADGCRVIIRKKAADIQKRLSEFLRNSGMPAACISLHGSSQRGTSAHLQDDMLGRRIASDADLVLLMNDSWGFQCGNESSMRNLEGLLEAFVSQHYAAGNITRGRYGFEVWTGQCNLDIIPAVKLNAGYIRLWDSKETAPLLNNPSQLHRQLQDWASVSLSRRAVVALVKLWNRRLKAAERSSDVQWGQMWRACRGCAARAVSDLTWNSSSCRQQLEHMKKMQQESSGLGLKGLHIELMLASWQSPRTGSLAQYLASALKHVCHHCQSPTNFPANWTGRAVHQNVNASVAEQIRKFGKLSLQALEAAQAVPFDSAPVLSALLFLFGPDITTNHRPWIWDVEDLGRVKQTVLEMAEGLEEAASCFRQHEARREEADGM
ncbi:unnamed protein product [Symbiodinium sp. CCMP2456]|nr:unnamed protein product [Symbiodinium sp. CCMP2456]